MQPRSKEFEAVRKVMADQPAPERLRALDFMEQKAIDDGDLSVLRAIRQYRAIMFGTKAPKPPEGR